MKTNEVATIISKALDRIKVFFTDGEAPLSAEDELILKRWNHAYTLITHRKYTEDDIIKKLCAAYDISSITARNDIANTYELYGSTMVVNKKFLLVKHAENIQAFIEECKENKKNSKLLPKLFDVYTRTVSAIPESTNEQKLPPPVMHFHITAGQSVTTTTSVDDAKKFLENYKPPEDNDTEDIDYLDVDDYEEDVTDDE